MEYMRSACRRVLSLFLIAVLMVTALGGMLMTVSAAESEPTSSYVLGFDDGSQPYLYGSRYECKHSYNDPAAGPNSVWTYWNAPEVFNLVYTEDGVSKSIPAYCTDADTSTRSNTYYRRINLEDSRYHESDAPGRLRSVVLHTFPYVSVEQVALNTNAVLGEGAIQELTQGEVISATQQAIWEITHGNKYNVDQNYGGIREMDAYDASEFVHPESLDACVEGPYTASNIENLYNYFLNLAPIAPMADAVSEYSITDVRYDADRQADGTYTVTVSYHIYATINSEDSLTLTAYCGDLTDSKPLTAGEETVTFTGLSDRQEVKLVISGYQTGGDVYLFDAMGDRATSQSMVGYDNTTLPVYAEVVVTPERILNIYKTTDAQSGKIPLENIEFAVYQVATMEQLESGQVKLSEKPTAEVIASYRVDANLVTTLTTDSQGHAVYNFTQNGNPDGVYMIVEKENPAVIQAVDAFFVIVPGTTEDGSGYAYTVNVYPKNTTETGPDIKKDVTQIENDHDTFDVDEIHTWIIRGGVPAGIAQAQKYVITDTLDYRLTLKENFVVKVGPETDPADTEAVILQPNTDYVVTVSQVVDDAGNKADTFEVALTADGMKTVAAAVSGGTGLVADYEIRVYFDAAIDSDAQMGQQIPNQAKLQYTNVTGISYDAQSDIPEVHTGGIRVLKVDSQTEEPLAGATFKLARQAVDGDMTTEKLIIDGVEQDVVYEEFYIDTDLTQKAEEYTTTEDGTIIMYGLAYGTYYLVETKAPAGYNLLTMPVQVTVGEESHLEEQAVTVVNTHFVLPETGGMGTTIFTVIGLVLLGGAACLTIIWAKKKA